MKKIIIFLILCLSFLSVKSQYGWQYWNEAEISYNLTDKTKFTFGSEQRFVDNLSYLGVYNVKVGVNYKFTKNFNFTLNYKYEPAYKKSSDTWISENRIDIIPIFEFKLENFKFKFNDKIELRAIESDSILTWRWVPGLKIKRDIKIKDFVFTPYVYQNFYYNTDYRKRGYNQNRLYMGIEKKITKHIDIAVYYMLLSVNPDVWHNINTFGTFFSYKL
jgi:hypothetical protein